MKYVLGIEERRVDNLNISYLLKSISSLIRINSVILIKKQFTNLLTGEGEAGSPSL